MNILFVLENYFPHIGGVERVFKSLAEGLVKEGHTITIVTHLMKGTKRYEKLNGVEIHRVSSFGSRYWFTLLSIPRVLKQAKRADLIHTTTYNGAPPAWLASKVLNKPIILTVHEVWGERWKRFSEGNIILAKTHQFLERTILRLGFDRYVAVSQSTSQQLHGKVPKRKIRVVHNGLDYTFWNKKKANKSKKAMPYTKNKFVGLFYGRPGITKGLDILIKAMPSIISSVPTFHLIAIVSQDKAYKKRARNIKNQVSRLGVENNVTFLEPVSQERLRDYIYNTDCTIVPSLAEGFGFVVAEASAMGTKVIASNVDSIPEVISGKWKLFKAGSQQALAGAIIDAYYGRYRKTKIHQFTIEENIKKYQDVYREIIK